MSNTEQIRISAKQLGELALADFCPRCFWIRLKLHYRLPFQIFPGIFSSLDVYTKTVVESYIDRFHSTPPWLAELGELVGYREPPHWSQLRWVDRETNIMLTGTPDGVLVKADRSLVIIDNKTAKYTEGQDELLGMYEVQLNCYAVLGELTGLLAPVSALHLVYYEPITSDAKQASVYRTDGFNMGFHASLHRVPLRPGMIPPLLARTRNIYEMAEAPEGREGCKNCRLVADLQAVA